MKLVCVFLVVFTLNLVRGKNILTISPVGSPSHSLWHIILNKELVNRGHNVTLVMPDYRPSSVNYTVIHLEGIHEKFQQIKFNWEELPKESSFSTILFKWMDQQCHFELQSEGFQKLKAYPPNFFDLIILDVSTGMECFYPLVKYFGNPPLVGTSPLGLVSWTNEYTGDWLYPSISPHYSVPYAGKMSFFERLHNFLVVMHSVIHRHITANTILNSIQPYYPDMPITSDLLDLNKNFSLFLINIDFVMGHPRPIAPNVIPIGGLHVKLQNTISKEVQSFLDQAHEGVILFSLGTNVNPSQLAPEKVKIIIETLKSAAPYKIIMKWSSDTMPNKPDNVFVQKWLPQYDVLNHPNVKLLFNHGGELSLQEAIFAGKPVLGMPFFLDQRFNMNKVVRREIGLSLDYLSLTLEDAKAALKEILTNDKYRINMENLSKRVRDQPQSPMDRGIFWIEYILRHGHSKELQCASLHQPFWTSYCLDILGFIFVSLYLIYKVIQKTLKKIFKGRANKKNITKTKKRN